jgi:polar amino acid transport system substrate-binding protein
MKRHATSLIAIWLLLVCNVAVAAEKSTFPDIQRILDRGTLRVAMLDREMPPLIMTGQDGTLTGSDVDLARDLARKMGVDVQFVRSAETSDEAVDVVARGEADLGVSFLSSDVRRAKRVLFSQPYLEQKRRVFYNRAAFAKLQRDYPVDTIRQLLATDAVAGLQIGVVEGSIYGPILQRDYPQLTVRSFPRLAELVNAVKEGRIAAGFHGELRINYYMRRHPETAIYIGLDPEAPYPSDIRIAVRPDAPNLQQWVNIYLANHVGQMDASELIERYVGSHSGDD